MRLALSFMLFWLALVPAVWAAPVLHAPAEVGVGQPFLVALESSGELSEVRFVWFGREISVRPMHRDGAWRAEALLGTDVGQDEPGERQVVARAMANGREVSTRASVRVTAVAYPEQHLSLPPAMVTPPAEVLERIARDREAARAALATMTGERLWRLPLLRPVPGDVSSAYGLRRVLNGQPRAPHRGVDFRGPEGQGVAAVADGRVVLAADQYYAGKSLFIDHGQGVVSVYFHLSEIIARPGQLVLAGEIVGLVGATGRVTGPHLHFGLALQGRYVDPMSLLGAVGE